MALERVTAQGRDPPSMAEGQGTIGRVERQVVAEQVRAAAWLGSDGAGTAVLYKDDLIGLESNEPALFFGGAAPNMGVEVHLLLDAPSPIDSSTLWVHFRVDSAAIVPRTAPGKRDVGSLQIALRPRDVLVVPSSAVLYSAQGAYVLAAPEHGETFAKRLIQIGRILDSGYVGARAGDTVGAIVVLSGLEEGERVIAGNAFFVDAERRLKAARGQREEVMP
jgi:hypothetical protein